MPIDIDGTDWIELTMWHMLWWINITRRGQEEPLYALSPGAFEHV